jgi:acetoacetyl-CoA synthetase
MDVHVYDEQGAAIIGKPGELVCAQAFPSMPIGFWNDPEKAKYRSAYFSRYENVWCHGDWAQETDDGSFIIFGRSDATLNPSGVRIGTAELYQQVEAFPEIAECLATVLRHDGDEQIVLFVKMASGQVLDEQLVSSIRQRLRQRCSARHVPAYIVAAPDIPRTISGKISELAVRSAISNQNLGNAGALANPECMAFYREWKPPRSES